MPKTPSYRHRSDKNVGVVTLTDSATRERRDFYLGPYEARRRERIERVSPVLSRRHAPGIAVRLTHSA